MEIFALKGHIVKVTEKTIKNGSNSDKELAKKYLEVGKEYIVDHTDVSDWSTDVYLREIPDVRFNSVNFKSVSKQTEAQNACHDDYEKFNFQD